MCDGTDQFVRTDLAELPAVERDLFRDSLELHELRMGDAHSDCQSAAHERSAESRRAERFVSVIHHS
jgi:hypothetical protein